MTKGITRRLLAKNILLTGSAFAFLGLQNKGLSSTSFLKIQPLDEHFVSINGWVIAKSDLDSRGNLKNVD